VIWNCSNFGKGRHAKHAVLLPVYWIDGCSVGFKILQQRATDTAGAFGRANYRNRFWSEHRVQCRAAMAEEIALPLSSRAPSAHNGQANLSSVVYLKKFFTEVIAVCVHQPPIDPYGLTTRN